jgi:hypothetical protein
MCNNVFLKSCPLREEVEKYSRTKQAIDDNIMLRKKMQFACRVTTAGL